MLEGVQFVARSGVLPKRSDRPEKWTLEPLVHRLDSEPGELNDPCGECAERGGGIRALIFRGRGRQNGFQAVETWNMQVSKALGRHSLKALGVIGPFPRGG